MRSLPTWWKETHAPGIELFRHYVSDFLHIEGLGGKEATKLLLIGALPLLAQLFFLVILPVRRKYQQLSALPSPDAFRVAVLADELWLITFLTAGAGLLVSLRWGSLLPDEQDRRLFAGLPVSPQQVFAAKGAALVLASAVCFVVLNTMPGVLFPALTSGAYAFPASLPQRILAHVAACSLGTACMFLLPPAMDGVIAHAVSPRMRARIGGVVHGMFVAVMLAAIVLSFSASPEKIQQAHATGWSSIVPFFWFLAVYQQVCGIGDAAGVTPLAVRAWQLLLLCFGLTTITWLSGLRRYRALSGAVERGSRAQWNIARLFWRHPVQHGIADFAIQTLSSSHRHKATWMGYAGLCLATLLSVGSRRAASDVGLVVVFHLFSGISLMLAARHVFSIPVDLRANWIFQLHRQELRNHVPAVVPRSVHYAVALIVFLLPLPVILRYHGWTGMLESVLLWVVTTLIGQILFLNWAKIPFACSACPATTAPWMRVAQFFVGVGLLLLAADGLTWVVHRPVLALLMSVVVSIVTIFIARHRLKILHQTELRFEESLEAPVEPLALFR